MSDAHRQWRPLATLHPANTPILPRTPPYLACLTATPAPYILTHCKTPCYTSTNHNLGTYPVAAAAAPAFLLAVQYLRQSLLRPQYHISHTTTSDQTDRTSPVHVPLIAQGLTANRRTHNHTPHRNPTPHQPSPPQTHTRPCTYSHTLIRTHSNTHSHTWTPYATTYPLWIWLAFHMLATTPVAPIRSDGPHTTRRPCEFRN
jgi:hypothetical protein